MSDWDADEHDERPTLLGWASVALGLITLCLQPFACCLSVVATIPLFALGVTGLVMGLAAYRNSMANNYSGLELGVIGITLGALNLSGSLLWCGLSSMIGGLWFLGMAA